MELVNVKNLTKTFEDKILFENSSFSIQKGDKIGLLGKNGSGKTTLLNILFKNETIDFGTVYKQNDLFLAYFKQNLIVDTDVFDYLIESEDVENKISLITKYLKLINMPQEILQKNMSQISGGEITKLQLIKIFILHQEIFR